MAYRVVVAAILIMVTALAPVSANAAETKKQGLSITPARQEQTVTSGKVTLGSIQLANYTEKPLTVNLSVKQFSLIDYTYDYIFSTPQKDWIHFEQPQIILQPGKVEKVKYAINVPASASPGGHYFSFFASADMSETGFKQTAQVVSLQYLKVAGKLVQSGTIQNGSVPFLNMGNEIVYKFDARNTGNVHYNAYFFGQLESLFGLWKMPESTTSHVLMPGTLRTAGGSVPTPLLPGIYKMSYGYKSELNSTIATKSSYILFVPPWSIVMAFILVVVSINLWRRKFQKAD